MTREEIINYCERFQPGDRVLIPETVREEEVNRSKLIKREGTVIERYPNFLLIAKGQFRECFTYADIALFGAIEKKKGRRKSA